MDKIEQYLIRNLEHLDLIIEQVVVLMPLSYFYAQAVRQPYFTAFRQELDFLDKKCSSYAYRNDKNAQRKYKERLTRYQTELEEVGEKSRQEFLAWLLCEDDEVKSIVLFNMISRFRLLKYLRSFNNE